MDCPACGTKNNETAKTCTSCGTTLVEDTVPVQTPNPQPEVMTNDFNEQFIYNNQANFNSAPLEQTHQVNQPVENQNPTPYVNPNSYNPYKTPPKKKSLASVIVFASILVSAISLGFLSLLFFMEEEEYINIYACSVYYENMPPKEMSFNITFELTKDSKFSFKLDDNNYMEGDYEVLDSRTDGENSAYTMNLNATIRVIAGEKQIEQFS
ncbi:MAG: zinc ribbon domain-containing protein [Bacilli bacterium]|nr:zinc ribbon domain-containing protein [Bacilli bacterium]